MITNEMRNIHEMKMRIARAKNHFYKLGRFLTNKKINIMTRKRIVDCYVHSTLMYGAETWTITKDPSKRLEAFEMWCYRRLLKLSWTRKISYERVLEMAEAEKKVLRTIKNRKLKYYGHVIRHQGIQKDSERRMERANDKRDKDKSARQERVEEAGPRPSKPEDVTA